MVKAIFFDVDGTLVSHTRNEVSASTRAALKKLREKGIRCVIATGRHMPELDKMPVQDIAFDGYITLNGQLCLDGDRNVIYGNPITGADKERILRMFAEKALPVILVEREGMYINYINHYVEMAQKAVSTELPNLGSYGGKEIYQAIAYVEKGQESELEKLLPECRITRWSDYGVDIISRQGGKVPGIKQYLDKNNISRQETMAFGDGENDMEMLRFVQTGIAMGNAAEAVKACADHVTASVDEDGIEKALIHFGLL